MLLNKKRFDLIKDKDKADIIIVSKVFSNRSIFAKMTIRDDYYLAEDQIETYHHIDRYLATKETNIEKIKNAIDENLFQWKYS